MLKPRVLASEEELVLRNMLETVRIPMAAIEQVVIRQVLAVRTPRKRYVSAAVGRSLRQSVKTRHRPGNPLRDGGVPTQDVAYADYVENRIDELAATARERAGVRAMSPEQDALADGVRRTPAWVEIGLIAALAVTFVVALVA
jgi:hypothetical protein